jgi:hypothetical protein
MRRAADRGRDDGRHTGAVRLLARGRPSARGLQARRSDGGFLVRGPAAVEVADVEAIRQDPARFRARVLVRVDGAGASYDLVKRLLSMFSPCREVLFTCGRMITPASEAAIMQVPGGAWKPGAGQDGTAEEDKDVAEITDLMSRAGNWPGGLRWIVRRVKPSRPRDGSSAARPLVLNRWTTSRTVSSSAATSRAIAGTSVPDADAMMIIARRTRTHACHAARSAASAGPPHQPTSSASPRNRAGTSA